MTLLSFSILHEKNTNREMIVNKKRSLKIAIYHLLIEPFKERTGYVCFYGDDHGDYLAFEVLKRGDDNDPSDAIKWYARYHLNHPDMELSAEDPRLLVN